MRYRFTSLLLVEERLLEADHFARRLYRQPDSIRFGYELNAFLSAARSVTFLLQKEMSKVPGFSSWWEGQQSQLRSDRSARFFVELRNFSQKAGRVSLVGSRIKSPRGCRRWSYRFAGNAERVPPELVNRDVAECCRQHVAKLAAVVISCSEAFPYFTCPRRALTPEGVEALGISIRDIEEALGFPPGWIEIGEPLDLSDRLRVLLEYVDGVDFSLIGRLAKWKPKTAQPAQDPSSELSEALSSALVTRLERRGRASTAEVAMDLLFGDFAVDAP